MSCKKFCFVYLSSLRGPFYLLYLVMLEIVVIVSCFTVCSFVFSLLLNWLYHVLLFDVRVRCQIDLRLSDTNVTSKGKLSTYFLCSLFEVVALAVCCSMLINLLHFSSVSFGSFNGTDSFMMFCICR